MYMYTVTKESRAKLESEVFSRDWQFGLTLHVSTQSAQSNILTFTADGMRPIPPPPSPALAIPHSHILRTLESLGLLIFEISGLCGHMFIYAYIIGIYLTE